MPSRSFTSATGYRYGFNGQEKDDEVKGEGNQQDFGERIYDPRLGRFLSVDPLTNDYPESSPYQFAKNNPIFNIDLEGLSGVPHLRKGETAYLVKINDKTVYVILNEKTPHKVVLSDGKKRETFNFETEVNPKQSYRYRHAKNNTEKKFILSQHNSHSLAFFGPQSDKFENSSPDVKNVRNFEFQGIKVLDVLKEGLKQGKFEIDIVGNVSTNNPNISGTDANINEFTKNRAESTKNELFGKDEDVGSNINTFGINDVFDKGKGTPKKGFETVSPKNNDALGIQLFFRKKENHSVPKI